MKQTSPSAGRRKKVEFPKPATPSMVRVLTPEHVAAIKRAFQIMNWYASPDVYNGPSGSGDPNAVLGEVYYVLACGFAETLREIDDESSAGRSE